MTPADLARFIRDVPDFPKPGILFKDITPLLEDPAAFGGVIDVLAERYKDQGITRIAGIESRGFLFGAPLALRLGCGLSLIRKKGKLPHDTVAHTYELEYGTDTVEMHRDTVTPNDRVLIVDDLLATGGTAAAAVKLLSSSGATLVEAAFLIELDFLRGREGLGVPAFAILHY